jgi:putative transposase
LFSKKNNNKEIAVPNYRRFDPVGRPVFVTIATYARRPWLADSCHVHLFVDALERVKMLHAYEHLAHVVMPDHVHWLFKPLAGANFSDIVGAVKREVTWRFKEGGGNGFPPYWQYRFCDHVIRDERDLARHLDYIHFNPVKHGLAGSAGEHPHSSFRDWVARGVYDRDWGRAEPASIRGLERD